MNDRLDATAALGGMKARIAAHAWAATPVGALSAWPAPLRTLVAVMVESKQPMFVAWGPTSTLLYNDAYAPLLGRKHPQALGRPFFDVWIEARAAILPLFDRVLAGESVQMDDIALQLDRHGTTEEAHFAFSYTPVRGDAGSVDGLFCACIETTLQVLANRRTDDEQARLRRMFAEAPGGMALLHGAQHTVEFANAAFARLVGDRDIVGRSIREGLPEVEAQGFIALLDRVYASGEAHVGVAAEMALQRVRSGPPDTRIVDFVYQPITADGGRVTGIFVATTDVTGRVRAEQRLREQGALNQQILDSTLRYAVVSTDLDGRVTSWNAGAVHLFGWSAADMLGLPFDRLYPEDDRAAGVPQRLQQAALRDGRVDDERWLLRRGGERFWSAGEITPLRDAQGQAIGYVKVRRDRSAERLAAEALMDSEARLRVSEATLRLATDVADIGFWDLDMATDALVWSDRTKAMFGISPGVPCSMRDFYAGLHPEDAEATASAFAKAMDPAKRAQYDVDYRTIGREDGVVRWVAAKGRALFNDAGTVVRVLGTAVDITARKSAQARQALLLSLSDQLRTTNDPRQIVRLAVGALGRHLAASRVGFAMVQPDDASVVLETGHVDGVAPLQGRYALHDFGRGHIADLRAGRTSVHGDVLAYDDSAQAAWAAIDTRSVVAVPLVRGGRLAAALFVNHRLPRDWQPADIALIEDVAGRVWDAIERARAEDGLRELNATLEARIEERTTALRHAEEALRHAQKMEAVGQLTGGIAHDFNNLLTGISGSLELLRRKTAVTADAQAERYLSVAIASAQRAAALTQRLLAFARRQPLDPKPVAVNALVGDIEELLHRTLGPHVALELVLADDLWPTLCDPNQLESALLNLAINARDAMPGGGRLTVTTRNVLFEDADIRARAYDMPAGAYVVICFSDTGTGMTPDVAARAFEPFFTTKPLGQGTGLGLSMLYGFVKQSRGHVDIDSEPDHGTTFLLYLPRHCGAAGPDAGERPEVALPRADRGDTVLVVEDEPAVRMLVVETLSELGYHVRVADDGPSGLRLLQSHDPIDLLVTDVGLPGLDGRQLADAARATRPGLKVLFMTGYAGGAAIGNDMLEPGMQMLTKPFAMEALATRVRAMIEGR